MSSSTPALPARPVSTPPPPYLDAAREEGQRDGNDGRVTYLRGDVVDLADLVRPAEIVTLDPVINVYRGWEGLAGLAAGRAKRLFGPPIRATPAW
jgi:hypothetical protein